MARFSAQSLLACPENLNKGLKHSGTGWGQRLLTVAGGPVHGAQTQKMHVSPSLLLKLYCVDGVC